VIGRIRPDMNDKRKILNPSTMVTVSMFAAIVLLNIFVFPDLIFGNNSGVGAPTADVAEPEPPQSDEVLVNANIEGMAAMPDELPDFKADARGLAADAPLTEESPDRGDSGLNHDIVIYASVDDLDPDDRPRDRILTPPGDGDYAFTGVDRKDAAGGFEALTDDGAVVREDDMDGLYLVDEETGEHVPALAVKYAPNGTSELVISKGFLEVADAKGVDMIEDVGISAGITDGEFVPVEHYYLDFRKGVLTVIHIPTGKVFTHHFTPSIVG
jgi:hypothetical protein